VVQHERCPTTVHRPVDSVVSNLAVGDHQPSQTPNYPKRSTGASVDALYTHSTAFWGGLGGYPVFIYSRRGNVVIGDYQNKSKQVKADQNKASHSEMHKDRSSFVH
jgi:hypothetical protein